MYRPLTLDPRPGPAEAAPDAPAAAEPLTHYESPASAAKAADSEAPTERLRPGRAEVGTPAGAPSLVGRCFDGFELLAEVGRGGMGVVYRAWQKSLLRMVALKMLRRDHAHDPVWLARFLEEARAVAGLSHPHIVQVYQVGECAAGHYFTMAFIDGPSLETVLQQGPLPVSRAVALLRTVARTVQYAHAKGILHRDLKPANVMLGPDRRPIVIDFGIAKSLGAAAALSPEGVMGTPAYMAPEQAGEEPARVGPQSDVYSLGALLYAMLTGRPPYTAGSALRTIQKVLAPEMPPAPRSLQPRVPAELEQICMTCLSKDPAQRYPTAQALAEELGRFQAARASRRASTAAKS
jgi:serine/threonine-protein kinase